MPMRINHADVHPTTRRMAGLLRDIVTPETFVPSAIAGVYVMRTDRPAPARPMVYEPGVCVLAGGRKVARLGDKRFAYDPDNFLVLSVPLPLECEVFASADDPVVGFQVRFDPATLAELIYDADGVRPAAAGASPSGIFASRMTDAMRDACLRLVECLASPADAAVLGPGIVREIAYRILATEQAAALRATAVRDGRSAQIGRALGRIHADYDSALSVVDLADEAAMSVSSFHENFRAVTNTSPLQYLKTIRLHKARLLMIHEGLTASEAATRVGYESPSQFSREFKRLFGDTPAHDASASRAALRYA